MPRRMMFHQILVVGRCLVCKCQCEDMLCDTHAQFSICIKCAAYVENTLSTDNGRMCTECADDGDYTNSCTICDVLTSPDAYYDFQNREGCISEEYVCRSCFTTRVYRCNGYDCDVVFVRNNRGLCDICTENSLQSWDANVLNHKNVVLDTTKIYYGVELEVEWTGDHPAKWGELISAVEDCAIVKGDGSLDYGAEIVTIPASLAKHKEWWPSVREKFPSSIRSWDTSTCGMHVHVSRKPLTQLQIGKMLVFLNAKSNRHWLDYLAGRGSTEYCNIYPKKFGDVKNYDEERYEALNLCNAGTVEFRVFRGTLNVQRILRNIEYVAAVVDYCGIARTSARDMEKFSTFIEFLGQERKTYPALFEKVQSVFDKETPNKPCV